MARLHKTSILFFFFIILIFATQVYSQGFYFGRNKVQYTKFDWQILRTKHFDIYYYPEMQDVAEKGAKFAEDAYNFLQTKFNHTVNSRIPLIFYSTHMHFQQTNITPGFIPEGVGGFFEFLKGRVVIPNNGNTNQFKKVIWHELVHVYMHSKISRVHRDHGRFNTAVYPPLWFTEGLAEHWSTVWDSQAEMVIKDAVLNNYMVPLQNIWSINGTYTMYKAGQNILNYIAEKYGDDKVLLLMENLWKHDTFQECFIETIGMSYAEFDEEWLYHLQKKYYPVLAEDDFSRKISHTVVRDGYNFKPSYFTSKGERYVVFTGNRTGYSSIFMRRMSPLRLGEDEDSEVLVEGESSSDFESFHLFSSKIDVNNSGILAFGAKSGENDALYLYDIPERDILHKYYFDNLVAILSPNWSADGKKIVFTGLSFGGYNDLYMFDTETEELIQLTNDFYDDIEPSWSPDGNFITFSSDRTDFGDRWAYNIFVINVNTGEIQYITYGKHKDVAPVFSPDGKYIAFTSDRDLKLNIYMAELDGQRRPVQYHKMTNFANATFDPEWTEDGGMLFGTFENRSFQIRYMEKFFDNLEMNPPLAVSVLNKRAEPWEYENLRIEDELGRARYTKKYNLDVVQSQVSQDPIFGTTGGAQAAFTDIMGNDQYHILLYNNARATSEILNSWNVAITKVSLEHRTNYAVGAFRYAGRYFNYDDSYFFEERVGGFIALSYPLSKFLRVEFSSSYSYSDKEIYGLKRRYALLAANHISFTKDNSLWGPSGPLEGHRLKFTLGNTFDLKFSNVNYFTIMVDFRKYFRLSMRSAYAIRLMFLKNEGREARRFYIGGSWDMRGYPLWSIRGRQISFISQELRFPFIDLVGIRFPFISIGFNSIRGALFVDAGKAWNSTFDEVNPDLIGSFGVGLRMRLIGYLVLRLDIGKRTNFRSVSDGVFTQFFFGWDF